MNRYLLILILILSALAVEVEAQTETTQNTESTNNATETQDTEITILVEQLNSTNVSNRVNAIKRLGELNASQTVPRLTELLKSDPNIDVRGWILRTLNRIGSAEAIEAITYCSQNDPDQRVRQLASNLLVTRSNQQTLNTQSVNTQPSQTLSQTTQPTIIVEQPRRHKKRGFGLMIGGWSTFGGTFGAALITGSELMMTEDVAWELMIPFVGPILLGANNLDFDNEYSDDDDIQIAAMFWLTIWSLAQVAGVTMAIIGHVMMSNDSNEQQQALTIFENDNFGVSITPYFYQNHSGNNIGISLSGWFI